MSAGYRDRGPESARPTPMQGGPALEATLRALLPDLRGWMARFLGPGLDVEDAVQEALIELARALARFRGDSSVRTYAYRIALRVASRHRARRARTGPALALVADIDERDPEVLLGQRQALVRLHAALDALTDAQREAILLCAIERVPHADAAEILGIDVEALRQRIKRGRAELRARLVSDPLLGGFFVATSGEDAT